MGNHMLDVTSPELNGEPFTRTFTFGTWDGDIHFFEPMITMDTLANVSGEQCFDLKMPSAFAEAAHYPTRYCMAYQESADRFHITLDEFTWFEGE